MKVLVNGIQLDTSPNEVIAVTLTANSLEDASAFQSSYTNAFDLLPTRTNTSVLGAVAGLDAQGKQYLATDVQLFNDKGLPIVTGGKMLINEFLGRSLKVNVFAGVVDFFDELGETKLFELDFSAYAHTWNLTNVTADTLNVSTDGYVYAVADFGNLANDTASIDVRQQYPSFYVKKLMQLIASQLSSYSFVDSEYFADTFFESLVIPFNGEKNPYYTGFEFDYQDTITNLTATTYNLTNYTANIENDNFVAGVFTAPSTREVVLTFDVTIDADAGAGGAYAYTINLISDINGTIATDSVSGTDGGGGEQYQLTATLNASLVEGEEVRAQLVSSPSGSVTSADYTLKSDPPAITFGSTLNIESLMPDLSCADFIKSVWRMLAIQPQVDVVTKTITLRDFQTYSTDTANAIDLSNKVDSLKDIQVEYSYGDYAKLNTIVFDEDTSLTNPTFADSSIAISNENLDSDYEMIQLDFAPTASRTIKDGDLIICKLPILNGAGVITNELKPRIAYVEQYTGIRPALAFTDGTSTNSNVQYSLLKFVDTANSENLSFINNLLTERFAQFALMIQKMQKVTLSIKLTDYEFSTLDFFKLVHLNYSDGFVQLVGYYLLQEVKEYRGDETVQVELINVNIV